MSVEEVRIPVAAYDAGGRFDPTLSVDDLLVREDGEPQRVTGVYRMPARVLLLADTGGELNPVKTARLTGGVAAGLVSALRPGDSVAVMQVSGRAELIQGWTSDLPSVAKSLQAKLLSSRLGRRRAVADALLFRARRRTLFPSAAAEERGMEMHEGLAEYTGIRLSGSPDPARLVIDGNLSEEPRRESFVRSFAYASGPAYGLLLDKAAPGWTRRLRGDDDLAELLRTSLRLTRPRDEGREASERARVYGGEELSASELRREEERRRLVEGYRARLVEGPVLSLPLRSMRMSFDPGNIVPLEGLGTVYPNIRIVDVWGILTVARGGALLSQTFSAVNVTAPSDASGRPLRGDGWTLELSDGWSLAPGAREGDYVLRKS